MILLAALHGYHASPPKCEEIVESLCSLLSFNLVYGKEYKFRKTSPDLDAIGKFYEDCKKKKKKK